MPASLEIDYLSAEQVVQALEPGVYDDEIAAAYASEAARLRIKNELIGFKKIAAGRYEAAEHQKQRAR